MTIDQKTLEKIAHLARLKFNEQEESKMLKDMNNMLSFVEKLQEVDTSEVMPLQSMSFEINNLRKDISIDKIISREQALSNAPKKDLLFFRVPKVIE